MTNWAISSVELYWVISLGLVVGSFLNVCIARLPKGEDIIFSRSSCRSCRRTIPWYFNIPVASYLIMCGKCRFCGKKIPIRYLIVEIITPILFLLAVWKDANWATWPFSFYFMSALIAVTFIDLDHWIIPDVITLPGILIGIASGLFVQNHSLIAGIAGTVVGGGLLLFVSWFYSKWKKQEGIGGGDVKLLAMAGAFLGVHGALVTLVISSISGSIIGSILMFYKGKNLKMAVPFGPFLALGMLCSFLFGEKIIAWYFNFSRF